MGLPKKLTSVLLAACMVFSVAAVAIVPAAAETTDETYAMDTVRGSNILHCFDWSYNSIKANLADIAAAGYTAVQTSPVQQPKDYESRYTIEDDQWWKLYQPLGLRIAPDGTNWFGTKAELTALCTEAEKYHIKVIVDIVANHLANNEKGGTYAHLNSGVDADLKNLEYFHSDPEWTNDDSRYNLTQRHQGMPDLNTAHPDIQAKVLSLLKECVDCGVDGFRFDAAKHIELPNDDANIRSDFWPYILNGVKNYTTNDLYFYGEILGGAGVDISNYTAYMAITDNYTGDKALDKAYYHAASELADSTYYKGASAANSVLWVESHDTFKGESGSAGMQNTSSVTSDVINKAWAIVGARADSTALFYARPNSVMGSASSDTNWKSTEVAEVNKFKNHFAGTNEYLASSGNEVAYIERGTKGVVISKLDGAGNVSIDAHQMKAGTYTDQITKNTFTVANGKITGTVGSTGIAVVYNPDESVFDYITADTLYLDPSINAWKQTNERYAMHLFNGTGSTAWVGMTDADGDGVFEADVPEGNWTNVIFCRMNGNTTDNDWSTKWDQTIDLYPEGSNNLFTVTGRQSGDGSNFVGNWSVYNAVETTTEQPTTQQETEPPTTINPDSDTYTVYAYNKNGWNSMNVYYWGHSGDQLTWPGVPMQQGKRVFTAEIPKDVQGIIFNDGSSQTVDITSGIADNAQWYIETTQTNGNYNVTNGPTYYLVGAMTDWSPDSNYTLSLHPAADGTVQYQLDNVALTAGCEIKITDDHGNWYPNTGGNYSVAATGTYNVLFRPNANGGSGWFQNYFKLESVTNSYTITWKNDDGTPLLTSSVAEGEIPVYTGEEPTKSDTFENTYTFAGWTPQPAAATGDAEYTAVFHSENVPTCNITLTNAIGWDENVCVYYWKGSQNNAWPGTPLTASDDDYFILNAQIPSNVDGIIFNNGRSDDQLKQTADITEGFKDGAHWAVSLKNNEITVNEVPDYYLVGSMTGWSSENARAFTPSKNENGLEEYKLSGVELKANDQLKVYSSSDSWFPGGYGGGYTVAQDGTYDIYFRPHGDGNDDWHQKYFYLANVTPYTITWLDGDGNTLKIDTVTFGDTPRYTGDVPAKAADAQYTYIFNNTWSPEIAPATANATYTAQFDTTVNSYRVVWNNDDGTELASETYEFGATPVYKGETPVKASTQAYDYAFSGWTPEVDTVTHEITYTAVYSETSRKYTVRFLDENGTVLQSDEVTYGEMPAYLGENPEKPRDEQWEYTFAGWTPTLMPVTDNTDYTPVYNSTPRRYRITWLNDNGNILTETECDYGTMPYYPNGNPVKENDDQFIYSFTGWSPGVTEVTGDATYTATYRSETRTYLITWHNYDGTILSSEFLPYGATPEYTGTNPDKPSDGMNHYVFSGWDEMIQPVSGEKHYTAQFDIVPHDYLVPDYTNWNYDEHWVEVTYHCTACGSEERHIVHFSEYDFAVEMPPSCTTNGSGHYHVTDNFNNNMIQFDSESVEIPATGHHYNSPTWNWSPDFTSATATFNCMEGDDIRIEPASVQNTNYREPECEYEGYAEYRATVTLDGAVFGDNRNQNIPAKGHQWGEPSWQLSFDKTYATATFECEACHRTDNWNTYDLRIEYYADRTDYIATLNRDGVIYEYTFTEPPVQFVIRWYDYFGTEFASSIVNYGQTPAFSGVEPTVEPDAQYHYEFAGWTPELMPAYGDMGYNARFIEHPHHYSYTDAVWDIQNHTVYVYYTCTECGYQTQNSIYIGDNQLIVDNAPGCTTAGSAHYEITDHFTGTPQVLQSESVELDATGHHWLPATWSWAENYSSATATFNCPDCGETHTVTDTAIDVAYNGDIAYYTANVTYDGREHTNTQEAPRKYFTGHTLTLQGDIGVNYYIALTDEEYNAGNISVDFTLDVEGNVKHFTVTKENIKRVGTNLYKATCFVAAAEMTYDITATLNMNGEVKATKVYSVKRYADYILAHTADKDEYARAERLVRAMLDYGARAQIFFDRNTAKLANDGQYNFTYEVSAEDINAPYSNMRENLDAYGLTYVGSTLIYLSETSLRHYYRVVNDETFSAYRESITLDGQPASFGERDGMLYVEFTNIAAKDLGKTHTFTIGNNSYNYSAMTYTKKVIEKGKDANGVELAKATVRYYNEALSYSGS